MKRPTRILASVAASLALFAAACGLSLSIDDVEPTGDGAPPPTGTNTSRPPVDAAARDANVLVDAGDVDADGAVVADGSSDSAVDASDGAVDASDGAADASDGAADGASDSAVDASDGAVDASVALPPASVVLRFEAAASPFPNDGNAARPAVGAQVTSALDAPSTGPAPATNTRSISVAANTRGWAKISPAQDLVAASPVTALTVAAWVKPGVTTGLATLVSYSSIRGGTPLFELARTAGGGVSFVMGGLLSTVGAPIVDAPSAFLPADGAWKFVAVTYDRAAGRACFYKGDATLTGRATLDGNCLGYANRAFTPSNNRTSALVVGNSADETVADPGGNPYIPSFGGAIDQVFVFFGSALSLDQIRAVQGKNSYP